jgi:hypothetical protein
MAALQSGSKYSRTNVYAPFLNRFAPCHRTKPGHLETSFRFFSFPDDQKIRISVSSIKQSEMRDWKKEGRDQQVKGRG